MSKHSKNNTSSSVFTYAEKQKLKGVYGTIQTRIGQDSVQKFEDCTICKTKLIQPTCCDKGHVFCRPCVIEYLVKQKKKNHQANIQFEKQQLKQHQKNQELSLKNQLQKMEKFQKYDTFSQVVKRKQLVVNQTKVEAQVKKNDIKPTGVYELIEGKQKYVKSSFWTIENTPDYEAKLKKQENVVKCPGSDHKLTLKKLRDIKCKQIQNQYYCWICGNQIGRQKIGAYKCGHIICLGCKSNKCQVCDKDEGWIQIQGSHSSFSMHNKAQIKTYTHAFIS